MNGGHSTRGQARIEKAAVGAYEGDGADRRITYNVTIGAGGQLPRTAEVRVLSSWLLDDAATAARCAALESLAQVSCLEMADGWSSTHSSVRMRVGLLACQ
jgi:hypothetical protein